MSGGTLDNSEGIDHRTSRSICDAIGQRLQKDLHPGPSSLSSYLQHLIDELRRQESEDRLRSSN
jgi:hypothetical protein